MQYIRQHNRFITNLPGWAQEMATKYGSQTANLYIIHGNIRDYLPHHFKEDEFEPRRIPDYSDAMFESEERFEFKHIQDYISKVLFGNENIIAYFDCSRGVTFCTHEMEIEYRTVMARLCPGADPDDLFSENPKKSFRYLETYFTHMIPKNSGDGESACRMVLIIDYAEALIPSGDMAGLTEDDRFCFVTLSRWANEPMFTDGDISIILLTENLSDMNPRLVNAPSAFKVEVPYPDEQTRERFLESRQQEGRLRLEKGLSTMTIAAMTSGLNLMHLDQIINERQQEDEAITMDFLRHSKKMMIENQASGMLEFMETTFTLDDVSGHEYVKKQFRNAVRAIKHDQLDVLPMGYLVSGPVGTGKSFMVSAFAGEIGIPMVRFLNFRSKWQGVTESNLERVLNILKSMAPVAVMVDEADAFLGDREQDGGNGEGSRVFAQISNFMGNTEYRGRIIWFLITCRPDLIPIDLKRQGRAEEHLALFYPETDEDKVNLFATLVRKNKLQVHKFPVPELFRKYRYELSGADLEALLIRAKQKAILDNHTYISRGDLEEVLENYNPPAYPNEIRLQNLAAVRECTSRRMVPKRFQNIDDTKLMEEIQKLKALSGEGRAGGCT